MLLAGTGAIILTVPNSATVFPLGASNYFVGPTASPPSTWVVATAVTATGNTATITVPLTLLASTSVTVQVGLRDGPAQRATYYGRSALLWTRSRCPGQHSPSPRRSRVADAGSRRFEAAESTTVTASFTTSSVGALVAGVSTITLAVPGSTPCSRRLPRTTWWRLRAPLHLPRPWLPQLRCRPGTRSRDCAGVYS